MISFEQLIKVTGQIEVKRVRECALVSGLLTFPLRTVRDIQIDQDLHEAYERLDQTDPCVEGELNQWLELDDRGAPTDNDEDGAKTPTGHEPALPERGATEDRERMVRIPMPVRRASRIFTSRIEPPASPKKRELRDEMQITFQVNNPKKLGSKIHTAYERYKAAQTVSEARALGAFGTMIKYDVEKSYTVPGHALHEKSSQRQIRRRRYTGQQPGTKSVRGPADQPLINRGSTADFVPPSVYIKFRLFVLPKKRPGQCLRYAVGQERGLFLCWIDPTASRSTQPRASSPPRRAPPRLDWPVVCFGFAFDKSCVTSLPWLSWHKRQHHSWRLGAPRTACLERWVRFVCVV